MLDFNITDDWKTVFNSNAKWGIILIIRSLAFVVLFTISIFSLKWTGLVDLTGKSDTITIKPGNTVINTKPGVVTYISDSKDIKALIDYLKAKKPSEKDKTENPK